MLVLSRRNGERIRIGNAVVTLLQSSDGRARLGIDAPIETPILREELIDSGEMQQVTTDDQAA